MFVLYYALCRLPGTVQPVLVREARVSMGVLEEQRILVLVTGRESKWSNS